MKSYFIAIFLGVVTILFSCDSNKNAKLNVRNAGFDFGSIDSTKSPCVDFDSFANGNWKKKNSLPATESRWGAFEILDRDNKIKLQNIVDSLNKIPDLKEGTESRQIADFYRSYMDTAMI